MRLDEVGGGGGGGRLPAAEALLTQSFTISASFSDSSRAF